MAGAADAAKDVVCRLLSHSPDGRPTASEALRLPWLGRCPELEGFASPDTIPTKQPPLADDATAPTVAVGTAGGGGGFARVGSLPGSKSLLQLKSLVAAPHENGLFSPLATKMKHVAFVEAKSWRTTGPPSAPPKTSAMHAELRGERWPGDDALWPGGAASGGESERTVGGVEVPMTPSSVAALLLATAPAASG